MKKPNNVFAPLVIAGITVGFLASAYKYIFRYKPTQNTATQQKPEQDPQQTTPIVDESHSLGDHEK